MANYWCYGPLSGRQEAFSVSSDPNPTGYQINMKVAYVGSDVPQLGTGINAQGPFILQDRIIAVGVLFADTPAQILGKVVDAIVNDAASIGVTVARTAGLVSSFIRGA